MENTQDTQLTAKEAYDLQKQKKDQQRNRAQKRVGSKKFIIWGIGIVVALGLFYLLATAFFSGNQEVAGPTDPFAVAADDWVKGNPEAPLTLIEYGDFQCPACQAFSPLVKQLGEEYADELRIVYRHFPLTRVHFNAIPAAQASEAAGFQGKFWEMHDLLFERQSDWASERGLEDLFTGYAVELGLNEEQFRQDYNGADASRSISTDRSLGNRSGVRSTPSFYLQGSPVTGVTNYQAFQAVIESALGDVANN